MKAYKVEVLVIDHDGLGAEGIKDVLENTTYPNRCIFPDVMNVESRDIGEWDDSHPLNSISKQEEEYRRIFSNKAINSDGLQRAVPED